MKLPIPPLHTLPPSLRQRRIASILAAIVFTSAIVFLVSCLPVNREEPGQTPPATPLPTSDNSVSQEQIEDEIEDLDENIILLEDIVILALFTATLIGIGAQWLRVPYTAGLIVFGLFLTVFQRVEINTPNLILALLVPPLVFEAAFHLNLNELRRSILPILLLAVFGVLITTFVVGGIVAWGTGMLLLPALLFGSLVSATDPVSVVALFRTMGVPKRLQMILEGESLFNDGTAIVVFHIIIGILVGSSNSAWQRAPIEFLTVSGGGLLIGLGLGLLISNIITRIDDYLIETTLTTVLAYGSYLLAEYFHVSGVLAVVAAGLVNGNIGPKGMSPTTRIVVFNFWEYAAFIANTFVFLLIGLRIHLNDIIANWHLILWGILGILVARGISIYGLAWITREIPPKWRHVLYWGGLRGAISLALALSLGDLGEQGDQIQIMAFGVVLFTLVVQGFTMGRLVNRLKLVKVDEKRLEYERRHARAVASRAAYEQIQNMHRQGLISEHTWQVLSSPLKEHSQALTQTVREAITADPEVQSEELDTARREFLRTERSAFSSLVKDGVISHDTYSSLVSEVDAALAESHASWPMLIVQSERRKKHVNRLITAIIQEQDIENAINSLDMLGFAITRLPSTGGFLGRRNATILIGYQKGQESLITRALYQSCRTRVEYVTIPLEDSFLPIANPTPIKVGGATLFAFDVEHYEEI